MQFIDIIQVANTVTGQCNYDMEGVTNTDPEKLKGDVNEDGTVDINDVVNIINIMAGQSE